MRPPNDANESPEPPGQEARLIGEAGSYEQDARAQARARESWNVDMEGAIADLDLSAEFRAAGRTWAEADENGRVFRRR